MSLATMRFLAVAALVSCATASHPALRPPDARLPFVTWVGRWSEARACLVAPAQDLATGVAIAMQLGRDCSRLLKRLDVEIAVESELQRNTLPVVRELMRQTAREQFSPSKRTELIHSVDEILGALEEVSSESR